MSESPGSVTVSTLQRNILPHAVPSVMLSRARGGGGAQVGVRERRRRRRRHPRRHARRRHARRRHPRRRRGGGGRRRRRRRQRAGAREGDGGPADGSGRTSAVVVHAGLGEHCVVLDLRFAERRAVVRDQDELGCARCRRSSAAAPRAMAGAGRRAHFPCLSDLRVDL